MDSKIGIKMLENFRKNSEKTHFPRASENVEKLENIKITHFRKKLKFLENQKKKNFWKN